MINIGLFLNQIDDLTYFPILIIIMGQRDCISPPVQEECKSDSSESPYAFCWNLRKMKNQYPPFRRCWCPQLQGLGQETSQAFQQQYALEDRDRFSGCGSCASQEHLPHSSKVPQHRSSSRNPLKAIHTVVRHIISSRD